MPLIPHVIGALAISTGGQFLVTNMLGVSETGLYVVGAQIGAVMGIASDAFVKSYGPWLYEKLQDESVVGRHFIVGITYYVFLFFLLLSGIATVFALILFQYVVGDKFLPVKHLTPFFIFGNGFIGMYFAIAGFFFFTSKTKFVSIVTISSGVISILAMWILGNVWGLNGIVFGYFVSQVFMFMLAWIMSNLVYPMPWFQIRSAFAAVASVQFKK